MSSRKGKGRARDDDFLAGDHDSSDDAALSNDPDEDESDLTAASSDEDAGPSTGAGRPQRSARKSPPKKRARGTGAGGEEKKRRRGTTKGKGKAWEGEFQHTWDSVREDEGGSLEGVVNDLLISSRTKRVLKDTTSIQRGIIRHVYLVIDLSNAMLVREYRATWLDLTLQYAREFVAEFFDQNPISQLAIVVTREGSAERLSALSGNPVDHAKALSNKKRLEPRGEPSLQNVLEMARSGLSHLPPHGSREVIIILGSLTTCDPGNIHTTISAAAKERIRVNIIGLSAEMRICKDICTKTKGTYSVARDDTYLRELLFEFVLPPPTLAQPSTVNVLSAPAPAATTNAADLMLMGFPTLVHAALPGLCACHGKLKSVGYTCPRCKSRMCDVPTECRVCNLTVVSSPHLARSYRHLFPIPNYDRVLIPTTSPQTCYACSFPFQATSGTQNLSPTGRYSCPKCGNHFCLECDSLVHSALGVCPGCL